MTKETDEDWRSASDTILSVENSELWKMAVEKKEEQGKKERKKKEEERKGSLVVP
jgi:hypothetical protein